MRLAIVSLVVLILAYLVYYIKPYLSFITKSNLDYSRWWSYSSVETGFRDQSLAGGPWAFKRDNIAVYAVQGRRTYMEDRFSIIDDGGKIFEDRILGFAIYDGHGGSYFADYAERSLLSSIVGAIRNYGTGANITQILIDEFMKFDDRAMQEGGSKQDFCGSTGLVGILIQNELYIANVGDCRAVVNMERSSVAVQITTDHKPDQVTELSRIKAAGGFISFKGVWRVGGALAVSRSFGDGFLKKKGWISAMPDVFILDWKSSKVQYLIFASDGLWDVISSEEAVELIIRYLNSDPYFGAKQLVEIAFEKESMDNICAMIIKF